MGKKLKKANKTRPSKIDIPLEIENLIVENHRIAFRGLGYSEHAEFVVHSPPNCSFEDIVINLDLDSSLTGKLILSDSERIRRMLDLTVTIFCFGALPVFIGSMIVLIVLTGIFTG